MRILPSESHSSILLFNIGQLVTLRSPVAGSGPRRGAELREIGIIKNGAVLCTGGKIATMGTNKDALRDPWIRKNHKKLLKIDCKGKVVIPGFVDAHTHPAFIAPRLEDFEHRISGATYEQIAAAGGGIRSSVDAVREATKQRLSLKVLAGFRELASFGTTTVEAKSGYGLSLAAELKSLEAIRAASRQWPGTVVPTLLGAHMVPAEFRKHPAKYVNLVCQQMIPQAAARQLARFVDVFCDRGAFTEEDALKVAGAARSSGLQVRAHISQLARTSLQRLLHLHPVSLDHLDQVNETDTALLARSQTVATLVPGANFFLGLDRYPPARKLIDAGAAVALATDYNPGSSPVSSMPLVMSLACTQMKMTPAEALAASTINGAWSLGMADRKGSIEPGKDADLAVFDAQDYREIAYWAGANRCRLTILNGQVQTNDTNEPALWESK